MAETGDVIRMHSDVDKTGIDMILDNPIRTKPLFQSLSAITEVKIMTNLKCPIWSTHVNSGFPSTEKRGMIFDSPRAGGKYFISDIAAVQVKNCEEQEKAHLTSWLVEQWESGVECPEITTVEVEEAKNRQPLSLAERISGLLKFLKLVSPTIGTRISVDNFCGNIMAWSELTKAEEVFSLLQHLEKCGLVVRYFEEMEIALTVDGYSHAGEGVPESAIIKTTDFPWLK